jgi:DNA-binding NarL/FixJ family response regulator
MSSLRILVADDHEVVRQGLRSILEEQPGWEICAEAASGQEAIAKANEFRPDVVVLDFSMPDLNGLEATRQIHRLLPGTEVLVLTMYDSERLAREFLIAGARGFVLKADAGKVLVEAVRKLSQHQPFVTAKVPKSMLGGYPHGKGAGDEANSDLLTVREREIVQLVAEGKVSKEIADRLNISVHTVETHRSNIMQKLGVHTVGELVGYAFRNRIAEA